MFKKYLLLIISIILIQSCYALTLQLNYTSLGPQQDFTGLIIIPSGDYNPDSIIKLSTKDSSSSKKLKDVIDCEEVNCEGVIDYYKSTRETQSTIQGTDILTGISIPKDVTLISNAKFDIECVNSLDCPETPVIDIGNDNKLEWIYPGQAATTFSTDFSGPPVPENIESIVIESNCQKLLLKKSMQYKIRSYIKQTSSSDLNVFISGTTAKSSSCNTPTSNWNWVECTIDLEKPIETNYYYVCLKSSGSGNLLASNSTAQYPQGYYGCPTSCQAVNKDYIIQIKGADYLTQLTTKQTYNLSNTRQGEYLYRTLTNYYNNCNFYEDYCTIPIRITSENNKTIKLSNLEYQIKQIDYSNKNQFLIPDSITKVSGQDMIFSEDPIIISLSNFDVKTPKILNTYELKLEFDNKIEKINYDVVNLPIPKINITKERVAILEEISLDASETTYPDKQNLKFKWNLGDNTTKEGILIKYSYLKSGTYTISLIATDTVKNISSLPIQKIIEVYSSQKETQDIIDSTLSKIERGISYFDSASQKTKQVYTDLDIDQKLTEAKLTLTSYKSKISTMSELQLQNLNKDINKIITNIPYTIHVTETLNIDPYLSYEDVNKIYSDKTTGFKETLQDLNSRIEQTVEAKLIRINYLSDKIEDYILVKNIITPQNSLKDISIIEFVPKSLATSESLDFFTLQPQITSSGNYLEVKLQFSTLDSSTPNVILYKIQSTNLDLIKDIKTVILPTDLREKDIPFECGNAFCNPAEDYYSCPEDCTCGNKICEADEDKQNCPQDCKNISLFILFLLILIVFIGAFFYAYKNPEFAKKVKLDIIIKKIKELKIKKPFSSESQLNKIVNFIKNAKEKGHSIDKIKKALEDKGWSETQINYALKMSK